MENLEHMSILTLSNLLRDGKISALEIMSNIVERIEKTNPSLNAFITFLKTESLTLAKIADADLIDGNWHGPLHGIPVGVKDFYDTAGIRTTAGFEPFQNRVPKRDARAVTKLKNAGAIIVGKTNMHQLGMGTTGLEGFFGPTANPWNSNYIPGGSSSGSAVAVASGLCYATVDTDAIGSCRLPAACCGVTGFKGTFGLISPQGILEGEQKPDETIQWLNHPGITASSTEDVAIMLNALAEREFSTTDYLEQLSVERDLVIGIGKNLQMDAEVKKAFETASDTFTSLGYRMKPVEIPLVDFRNGIRNIEKDRANIASKSFLDVDVMILPTTVTTVPLVRRAISNSQALSPQNTAFANYYGLPAISIPNDFDDNGLPLGIQIVGKPWDDANVLYLANKFQQKTRVIQPADKILS